MQKDIRELAKECTAGKRRANELRKQMESVVGDVRTDLIRPYDQHVSARVMLKLSTAMYEVEEALAEYQHQLGEQARLYREDMQALKDMRK